MGIKLYAVLLGLAQSHKAKEELVDYIIKNWRFLRQFLEIVSTL